MFLNAIVPCEIPVSATEYFHAKKAFAGLLLVTLLASTPRQK